MDKVSVEAFDRTSAALIKVIQEDDLIIEHLRAKVAEMAENGRQRWNDYESTFVKLEDLKAKIDKLMDLCEAQEAYVVEHSLSRDEASVDICDIREIFGP